MIRIAAVGDIHLGPDSAGVLRPAFDTLGDCADLLLLAGDLTRHGTPEEARVVAAETAGLPVPVVAVLGNHDYQSDRQDAVADELRSAGIHVLEGDGVLLDIDGTPVGIAGTKGFCGGFAGRSGSEFGEPEMKSFIRYTRASAEALGRSLRELREAGSVLRIALTHYAPVPDTLAGEPREIYPFLGSYLLAEAMDDEGADLAVHGHAHLGTEHGMTAGGVQVRNVAMPVIGQAFSVYHLSPDGSAHESRHSASRGAAAHAARART
ncbi:metallophosphoesterase [Streptomyces sp. NPDC048352]|uniref:metallophosphoesterase family protein n=1 Tax=Streptomyces sp. NPDC048352 TaxID=3154718 RepID=UPI00342F0112